MGHFGFFQLIKTYTETTFLIDEQSFIKRSLLHSPTKFKKG